MEVKYIGPISPIDVPAARLAGVKTGAVVDVPADLAGKAPSDMVNHRADTVIPDHHYVEIQDDGSRSSYDPGFGLLAQTGNWVPAESSGDDDA